MVLFYTGERNHTKDYSTALVADTVMLFWRRAFIPTKKKCHVKTKIGDLYEGLRNLQKSETRGGAQHEKNKAEFVSCFENLFDIAHADAYELIENAEDVEFLREQRKPGRKGSMIGVDETTFQREKRRAERELQQKMRAKRAKQQEHLVTAGEW